MSLDPNIAAETGKAATNTANTITPGHTREAMNSVGKGFQQAGGQVKDGWKAFAERFKNDGLIKAVGGMSPTGKILGATVLIGGTAAIVTARNKHRARVAEARAMQQQLGQGM